MGAVYIVVIGAQLVFEFFLKDDDRDDAVFDACTLRHYNADTSEQQAA